MYYDWRNFKCKPTAVRRREIYEIVHFSLNCVEGLRNVVHACETYC